MKCLICTKTETQGVYGCQDCVNSLLRVVTQLGRYWSDLGDCLEPIRGQTGRLKPGYGSGPPLRIEVVAFLDPRSRPDVDDDVRSLPTALAGLADAIAEERTEQRPGDALGYIHAQVQWCSRLSWFDDLAEDLRDLHRRARQLAGDAPPKAIAKCISVGCDGRVFWAWEWIDEVREMVAKCGNEKCNRRYTGLDWVRLQVENDREVA